MVEIQHWSKYSLLHSYSQPGLRLSLQELPHGGRKGTHGNHCTMNKPGKSYLFSLREKCMQPGDSPFLQECVLLTFSVSPS